MIRLNDSRLYDNLTKEADDTETIILALMDCYAMLLEGVHNYLAASANLVGTRGDALGSILDGHALKKLNHARHIATALRQLGGSVPGSQSCQPIQDRMQPPADPTDVTAVIRGTQQASSQLTTILEIILVTNDSLNTTTSQRCAAILADETLCREEIEQFAAAQSTASARFSCESDDVFAKAVAS